MKNDDLEAGMRELEWFHDLRVLPATWPVIRVDGRSFTRRTGASQRRDDGETENKNGVPRS